MMDSERNTNQERQREISLLRYVDALDRGDLELVAEILAQAIDDPELDRQIAGVNTALHAEAGLQPVAEQARLVRRLILRHLPSAVPLTEADEGPITVGEVAARLQAEHGAGQPLLPPDLTANQQLLASKLLLPASITGASVAKLARELGVAVSTRYLELFRRAAVMLSITRQRGQVQLAAARRSSGRAPGRRAKKREQP